MLTQPQASKLLSLQDSMKVEKMSVKDSSLVRLLSKNISDTVMFSIQEKCVNFVGSKIVAERLDQLIKKRSVLFISYFKEDGTDKQIKMHESANDIPYNGFSHFKLGYEEGIPETVRDAYHQLNDLNKRSIRKKYKKYRNAAPLVAN